MFTILEKSKYCIQFYFWSLGVYNVKVNICYECLWYLYYCLVEFVEKEVSSFDFVLLVWWNKNQGGDLVNISCIALLVLNWIRICFQYRNLKKDKLRQTSWECYIAGLTSSILMTNWSSNSCSLFSLLWMKISLFFSSCVVCSNMVTLHDNVFGFHILLCLVVLLFLDYF